MSGQETRKSESGDEVDMTELHEHKRRIPTYKVILLGEAGSGKTSLFLRYKYGSFSKGSTIHGTDRFKKEFVNDNGDRVQVRRKCWRCVICKSSLHGINI